MSSYSGIGFETNQRSISDDRGKTSWRVIAAASIGNALEWFDFAIYGFFAVAISKQFFPAASETVSLLITLATFGVTFFLRPLGAIVIGHLADRRGRKAAFSFTMVLMTIGTAIIAFAPGYATIGALAPFLIITGRLIQGFSAGGEFGSATAFLAEQDPSRRGFFASWQFASQGITTVLATGFGAVLASTLSPIDLESWGWRIPFVFGLLIGPVALYLRAGVEEPQEFKSATPSASPFREVLSGFKARLVVGLGAVVLSTVSTYTILFMPTYAVRELGLPSSGAFTAGILTGTVQIILVPFIGMFSDRYGRTPLAAIAAVAMLAAIYPLFAWLQSYPTLTTLLIVQAILGVLIAGYVGSLPALLAELFPTRLRTIGLSISYSFAVALFGGFAPFINVWLISATGSKLAPSFYMMAASALSFGALMMARRLGFR